MWTRHPGIARAALANIPVGPNSLRHSEGTLAILRSGGVPDQQAGWFIDRLSLYVLADAFEESLHRERGRDTEEDARAYFAQIRAYFESLPPDRFPVITSMVDPLLSGSGDERLEVRRGAHGPRPRLVRDLADHLRSPGLVTRRARYGTVWCVVLKAHLCPCARPGSGSADDVVDQLQDPVRVGRGLPQT